VGGRCTSRLCAHDSTPLSLDAPPAYGEAERGQGAVLACYPGLCYKSGCRRSSGGKGSGDEPHGAAPVRKLVACLFVSDLRLQARVSALWDEPWNAACLRRLRHLPLASTPWVLLFPPVPECLSGRAIVVQAAIASLIFSALISPAEEDKLEREGNRGSIL
jgi:hypothetical protein